MRAASKDSRSDRKPCTKGELNDGIREEIELQGLNLLGVVPQDDGVYECDCAGKPTSQLPADSPVKKALYQILDNLNL